MKGQPYRYGDVHPTTGMVFLWYVPSFPGRESWVTKERWERYRAYAKDHHEEILERQRKRRKDNADEERRKARNYLTMRRRTDPDYRLKVRMSKRIWRAIRLGRKTATTTTLLGCDIGSLRRHLESLWATGMSWGNYGHGLGRWNIDHIRPCASFDLTDPEQQKACFNYTNLQPLWHIDNLKKGDTYNPLSP